MEDSKALAIVKRASALKSLRMPHEAAMRECFDYVAPERGVGLEGDESYDAGTEQSKRARVLSSVASESAENLAANFVSGTTPSNSLWFEIGVDGVGDVDKRWLSDSATSVWTNIHASNFDAVGFDCCIDMTIAGQFAMFIGENDTGLQFEQWPLASCYFGASTRCGAIDTVFREVSMSAEQAVSEYGAHMVSEKTRDLATTKPDEAVSVVWAIYPRKDAKGNHKALFYGDYFARSSKRSGAWMTTYRSEQGLGGSLMDSIKGVAAGALLFFVSFIVLWMNEGRVDLSEIAKKSTPVKPDAVDSKQNGKFVSVTGALTTPSASGAASRSTRTRTERKYGVACSAVCSAAMRTPARSSNARGPSSWWRCTAMARPMPREAPVTNAIRPERA